MSGVKASSGDDETFMCIICMESPNERLMCRHCGKFICQPCTDKLFTNQETYVNCPHCRRRVQRSDFSRLPWLSDHLDQVNRRLQETTVDKCVEHEKEDSSLLCRTCWMVICARCIAKVFDGKHVDHDYYQIDNVYVQAKDAIVKNLEIASKTASESKLELEKNKRAIDSIRHYQVDREHEIQELCKSMKDRVKQQANELTQELENRYKIITKQLSEYDTVISRITQAVDTKSKIDLLTEQKELEGQLSKLPSMSIFLEKAVLNSSLSSPAGCPWQTGNFVIDHFSIKQAIGKPIVSSDHCLEHNQQWSLFVYPNGFGREYGVGLSVFLKLVSGFDKTIRYRFTIEMLHNSGNTASQWARSNTCMFKAGWRNGWNLFFPLADLRRNGFLWPSTDAIKLRFHLHTATMVEQMTLLQWHLQKSQREISEMKEETCRVQDVKEHLKRTISKQHEEINQLLDKEAYLKRSLACQAKDGKLIADQREEITWLKRSNSELQEQLDASKTRSKYHYEDSQHSSDSKKRARVA